MTSTEKIPIGVISTYCLLGYFLFDGCIEIYTSLFVFAPKEWFDWIDNGFAIAISISCITGLWKRKQWAKYVIVAYLLFLAIVVSVFMPLCSVDVSFDLNFIRTIVIACGPIFFAALYILFSGGIDRYLKGK